MKRIKNADINFKVNPKRINLNNFSMKFYTVNSEAYFFTKDQNNLVSVERDATIYDEDVIISGGTKVLDYYLPLDWSELVQLGEGVLNYRCINNIEDPYFPDMAYNQVIEDTTGYYIDSDIIVDPSQTRNIIERVTELESGLAVESIDREEADTAISGAVDSEIARAISAETELSERIDELASGTSEALNAEIERAISAETALQDAIDDEEARAIAIENAIRQDLTDETELRTSADTVILATVNDEIVRATSADTALDNKIDVETLRAIGVENAISGNLETYKATNNAALQAETTRATSAETKIATDLSNYIASNNHALADEVSRATSAETALNNALTAETAARESEVTRATAAENAISGVVDNYITTNNAAVQGEITRATSAETALQNAIGDETTARANADAALSTRIDNLSSASTAAIEAEEARAREAESGLTTALNNEVSRATSAETIIANSLNAEINRASSAETALNNQIDAEVLRATAREAELEAKIGVVSGVTELINAETLRATTAENALDEKIDVVSGNVITEENRAISAETALQTAIGNEVSARTDADTALDNKIDTVSGNVLTEKARAISAETALDTKINTVSGNVISETTRATTAEGALSGAIDTIDVRFFDDAKYEDSGNTKVINFYNGNVVKATIDCTDFLVDGMIDDVRIETISGVTYLVIDFNTASGKEDIQIPITDIFNPDYYYTKSETSGATEIANALALKLNISDFNTYSGAVDTVINSKAAQTTVDTLSGTVTAHTADSVIHVTASDKEKWNKVDDKADTTALTAVNDVLTAHTADSVAHITAAERTAWNAKADESAFTAHTSDSTIHLTSGNVQTQIDNSISGKADSSDVYLKSETSGATEISTAFDAKVETSAITSAVTSASTDSEIPSAKAVYDALGSAGGGKAVSAGTNISITTGETADTINCTLPISGSSEGIYTTSSYPFTSTAPKSKNAVFGDSNIIDVFGSSRRGDYNAIFGNNNRVAPIGGSAYSHFIAGSYNLVKGNNTNQNALFGYYNNSSNTSEFGCGQYNVSSSGSSAFGNSGNTLFSVGNGTANNARHNAFEIRQNGDIYLSSGGTDIKLQDYLGGSSIEVSSAITSGDTNAVAGGAVYDRFDEVEQVTAQALNVLNDRVSEDEEVTAAALVSLNEAVSGKQNQLVAGENISISGNVISATASGGGISSAECQTMINQSISGKADTSYVDQSVSGKADSDDVYTKSETMSTSEIDNALYDKQDRLSAGNGIDISDMDEISVTIPVSAGSGDYSVIEGYYTRATSKAAHAEGYETEASGDNSHAEGQGTFATFYNSHAEGQGTSATSYSSHAEGSGTTAEGQCSHAEGANTDAHGYTSHAEGSWTTAYGNDSHAEGFDTRAGGDFSHAEGYQTEAQNFYEHASGAYNISLSGSSSEGDSGNTLFTVGNGYDWNTKHNALDIRQNGDIYIANTSASGAYYEKPMIKLQDALGQGGGISSAQCQTMIDNSISGKTNQSDFTGHTADTSIHVTSSDKTSWNGAVTNASNAVTALGGLKLVKLSQSEYNNLQNKDNSTLYVIVG